MCSYSNRAFSSAKFHGQDKPRLCRDPSPSTTTASASTFGAGITMATLEALTENSSCFDLQHGRTGKGPPAGAGNAYGAVSVRVASRIRRSSSYFALGICLAFLAYVHAAAADSSHSLREESIDSTITSCAGQLANNRRCPLHWVVVATYTHCCAVDVVADTDMSIDLNSPQLISVLNTLPTNCCRNSTCPHQSSRAQHGVFTCPIRKEPSHIEQMQKTPSLIRCCHTECCRPPNSTTLTKAQLFGLVMLCSSVAAAAAIVIAFISYMMWKHEMGCFAVIPAWCPVCLQPTKPKISPMKRTGQTIRMGPPPMKVCPNERLNIPDVRWCYYPNTAPCENARQHAAHEAVMVRSYGPNTDVCKRDVPIRHADDELDLPFLKSEHVQPQYDALPLWQQKSQMAYSELQQVKTLKLEELHNTGE